MSDHVELALVREAISCGVTGCCEWEDKEANRVRSDLTLQGLTPEYIREKLQEFVANNGAIHQVREQRPQYGHRNYYYKVIFPEEGFNFGIFVEMELTDDDPDLPCVTIFNAHEQFR